MDSEIRKRSIGRRESKRLREELTGKFPFLAHILSEKCLFELGTAEISGKKVEIIYYLGVPLVVKLEDRDFVTVEAIENFNLQIPRVTVDLGAVPYIARGADVMAPGIVKIDAEAEEGSLVVVDDEKHHSIIAVGKLLLSPSKVENGRRGKAVKVYHHVGDKVWRLLKESRKNL